MWGFVERQPRRASCSLLEKEQKVRGGKVQDLQSGKPREEPTKTETRAARSEPKSREPSMC